MKINYLKISAFLLGALYIVGMLYFLYGCSANYHFGKFLKKGGTIDTTERIVNVEKTIKVNGKDSIIFVQMPLKCPEVQIPPTRQEIRYKYRIQRDSIETVRYVTKWKAKEVVKLAKVEKRKPFNWFWIGLAIGIFTPILFRQLGIVIMKRL
jgi:hypothetical protein